MSWLTVIAAALGLIQSLIQYLRDQKTIDAAMAEALLKSNRESLDAINKAKAARELVRANLARGADPMSDDGFKRND